MVKSFTDGSLSRIQFAQDAQLASNAHGLGGRFPLPAPFSMGTQGILGILGILI